MKFLLKKNKKLYQEESGAAVVLIALSMSALLLMVGLVVDVGNIFYAKVVLQSSSDAAALAGAGALKALASDTVENQQAEATVRAQAIYAGNIKTLGSTVNTPMITFPTSTSVKVENSFTVSTYFIHALSVSLDPITLSVQSTAEISLSNSQVIMVN